MDTEQVLRGLPDSSGETYVLVIHSSPLGDHRNHLKTLAKIRSRGRYCEVGWMVDKDSPPS